ncbi:MAG: DUF4253 domain-containing protein [Cyanobacteriota bacterium]
MSKKLNDTQKFDNDLISQLETLSNKKITSLEIKQFGSDSENSDLIYLKKVNVDGIMITSLDRENAFKLYDFFYKKVILLGYQFFLTNMEIKFPNINIKDLEKNYSYETYYDLAIIKANDQFDIIKLVKTEAGNYDYNTEQIIEKIISWEKYSRIQLTVVEHDRVEGYLLDKPKNVKNFANEIYEFAPDVVEQGTQTKKELINELNSGYFWLWWD